MEIEHETDSDQEVFTDEELTDWGHAAYMAGLSSDTDKVDEKLRSKVVSQLNNIRALNKQQQGMAMQREALEQVTLQSNARIEIHVLVELILQSTG